MLLLHPVHIPCAWHASFNIFKERNRHTVSMVSAWRWMTKKISYNNYLPTKSYRKLKIQSTWSMDVSKAVSVINRIQKYTITCIMQYLVKTDFLFGLQRLRTENRLLRQRIDNLEKVCDYQYVAMVTVYGHCYVTTWIMNVTVPGHCACNCAVHCLSHLSLSCVCVLSAIWAYLNRL